ncbi:MAG: ABC transporter ATP-binding protein [Winkia neuii]|uniref:ABC transporter ATP-binding protein n=1 Tax=Winkia neuii TaxID=33007 RepID=A0A2I1ILC7_9ACTO|nr:ABC transporter ATP-binding protein [Winkia neuii]OFJ70029.1 multidrug ABC transporter ATP-binding protein [Actinomyces sp. HMSC064C12]OFK04516.1 multidrug ABC transporter ATP-binding protein [Actinomyces sp. HMSC072A03]OFT56172.1 multidrug ABC transporter ATP-binding protein [Actinomyces sp. HMSC06A08]KWZ72036.1 ABC transporter, ATP-binding protein [Winkia neuii]MDK8099998.1 ABC transporter ATP-binding protein [Winkia neuii]
MTILQLDNVTYAYQKGSTPVLDRVNVSFERGKFYAILGTSGAGKSTLLAMLGGLDKPTSGTVRFEGEDIAKKGYSHHRRNQISLIFQAYNLIDYMTPLENLRLVDKRAKVQALEKLGLTPQEAKRNVMELSGGQQQRVAIGRSLVSKAPVILADEPTGNLDEKTAREITAMLSGAAHKTNKCVIVVTHSKELAREADLCFRLAQKSLVGM